MKKTFFTLIVLSATVIGCGPTTGEGGANDDGIQAFDSNGAFQDDSDMKANPSTDTAVGEHRVDLQKRDSAK